MIWGAVWLGGRSDLVFMTRDPLAETKGFNTWSYIQALKEGLLPKYDGTRHFQQDNAPIHKSEKAMEWILRQGISLVDWPPHSPDLNPIENIWALLRYTLYKMFPNLYELKKNKLDIEEFKGYLEVAWNAIPQEKIDKIILSMPRRVAALRKARGWYTKY